MLHLSIGQDAGPLLMLTTAAPHTEGPRQYLLEEHKAPSEKGKIPTEAGAAFSLAAREEGNNFHLLGGCEGAGVQPAAARAGAGRHRLPFGDLGPERCPQPRSPGWTALCRDLAACLSLPAGV